MSQPPAGFEAFAAFLGQDISSDDVFAALDMDTMWVESAAGRSFELEQNASIRGCYPGSFPGIDAYDEAYFTRKGYKRAVRGREVLGPLLRRHAWRWL